MHPNTVMKAPACRRVLHRLALWVRKRRVLFLQRCAKALPQSRMRRSTHSQRYQQHHDPLRLFERERQRQQRPVFEEAKIAFDMHLAFVAFQALLG
jgi:hypothetical protein